MENPYRWNYQKQDEEAIHALKSFLPEKIWDSHAHIYRVGDLNLDQEVLWNGGPEKVTVSVWQEQVSPLFPNGNLQGGLFFPAPLPKVDIAAANDFLIQQLDLHPNNCGLALVTPAMDPEKQEGILSHPRIVGLKPYHVYSTEQPSSQSSVSGFFPEKWWHWAEKNGAVVMLHIMKDRAIADPDNLKEIRQMCSKYPTVKLVLAHAARCFHSPNAQGIKNLRGLSNIWFDMSGICEPESILAILEQFGPQRLLWGSDFPVSSIRGRCITIGDGFFWLDSQSCDWGRSLGNPVLVGIESLRALKDAADIFGLNNGDIADIFFHNAQRLLELKPHENNLTQKLYQHAKTRIPGGVQLLSKRPENMAPGQWPPYFREARGCEVWDLDGKHYYDMSTNAVGSCLLGYSDPDINKEVIRRIHLGNMSSLNPPEEVELADLLCRIHPWAEQVRFVRGGGEACAMAVRIARATTDRSVIAVCGYHGWQDWYLAANLGEEDALKGHLLPGLDPLGVPKELRRTTQTFRYNDLEGFQQLIDQYGKQLAAVVMEPCRNIPPAPGFLEYIRKATYACGALLVFDEITVGWRLHFGGAHLLYGIEPDMAIFAKALGNGFPIGAVIGSKTAMDGAHRSFISSTYWTESVGPVAALATLEKMNECDIPDTVALAGKTIQDSWRNIARQSNLDIEVKGFPSLASFSFLHPESEKIRTLYTQWMLELDFLAGTSIYPTLSHTPEIVQSYVQAIELVFQRLGKAIHQNRIDSLLKGPVAKSGFERLI